MHKEANILPQQQHLEDQFFFVLVFNIEVF